MINTHPNVETYFRPSKLPVLNNRYNWRFIDDYFGMNASEIKIPSELISTPEDALINYFSILREAANTVEGKGAGCGSLGYGKTPFRITYNFLAPSYQKEMPYLQYLRTFENILHISLIKYIEVPVYHNPQGIIRYFVEFETIEGTERGIGVFGYYYGFVDLLEDNGEYKIVNQDLHGEDYLCAPYHGWSHDAQASVQIKYGDWCSLVDEMYPITQEGYIKNVSFKGTDGYDYLIIFFQLTNDTDVEIAQYRKGEEGKWSLIDIDPERCLDLKSE